MAHPGQDVFDGVTELFVIARIAEREHGAVRRPKKINDRDIDPWMTLGAVLVSDKHHRAASRLAKRHLCPDLSNEKRADVRRPISYAVFCLKKKRQIRVFYLVVTDEIDVFNQKFWLAILIQVDLPEAESARIERRRQSREQRFDRRV